MLNIVRTNFQNLDFIRLVHQLDAFLAITDGQEHDFYMQFNKIEKINNVLVLYENNEPIGCGSIKQIEEKIWEIKRMYTITQARGKGVASRLLFELESWARELGVEKLVLETGKRQVEAIGLYKKNNFEIMENYGQYANIENSVCFQKYIGLKK